MAKKGKTDDNAPSRTLVNRGRSDLGRGYSAPEPKEAHRLIRFFMNIRRASLRDAIVKITAELSTRNDKGQTH